MSDVLSFSGYLLKRGRANKRWRNRYFVVFKEELCYYTDHAMTSLRGTLPLRGATMYVHNAASTVGTSSGRALGEGGAGFDGEDDDGSLYGDMSRKEQPNDTVFSSFLRQFRRKKGAGREVELTNGCDTKVVECATEDSGGLYVLIRAKDGREMNVVAGCETELGMWLAMLELHSKLIPIRKSSLRTSTSLPMTSSPQKGTGTSRLPRSSSWDCRQEPIAISRKKSNVQFRDEIEDVCEFRKADPPRRVSTNALPQTIRRSGAEELANLAIAENASSSGAGKEENGIVDAVHEAEQRGRSGTLAGAASSVMVEYVEHMSQVSVAVERIRKVAMSIQKNVLLEGGVRGSIAVKGMREILRKLVSEFRAELAVACRRASVGEKETENVLMCAEPFVMTEVSERVFGICKRYARKKDEQLGRAATRLRSVSGSGYGVREHHRAASIDAALAAFNQIETCGTSHDKVLCLKRTIDALMESVMEQKRRDRTQASNGEGGVRNASGADGGEISAQSLRKLSGQVDAAVGASSSNTNTSGGRGRICSSEWACSTDDIISLLLSVICQTSVTNLVAHVTDVCQFFDLLGDGGGEDAYNITTLAVTTEYLLRQSRGDNNAG